MSSACSMTDCDNANHVDQSGCNADIKDVNRDLAAALSQAGYDYQLLVPPGSPSTALWMFALADQLRFVFRDITCR